MTDIKAFVLRDLTTVNLATLATAFVIAELLYKFRSFTLEAAAFLVTWYVLRLVAKLILEGRGKQGA